MLRHRLRNVPVGLGVLAALAALSAAAPLLAQDGEKGPIQDNSFLVEEAYNQETAVMQTIQTFSRPSGSDAWLYTITQEFPVPGQTHQLSFTLPLARNEELHRGAGDLFLNYRYQLVGSGETKVAVSPRLSVVVPTGDSERGLGQGGWGAQVNVPVSTMLAKTLVSHTNLGGTLIASARSGDRRSIFAGQSFIWLLHPNANVMLEGVVVRGFGGPGTAPHTDVTIAPGVRFAVNLGGLQIVPGLAYTIGAGPSAGHQGVFFYISFEHPFRRLTAGS